MHIFRIIEFKEAEGALLPSLQNNDCILSFAYFYLQERHITHQISNKCPRQTADKILEQMNLNYIFFLLK